MITNTPQPAKAEQLDVYCQKMALSIIPLLGQINILQYQNFLNMMYYYTFDSGKRLSEAAHKVQNRQIKSVFAQLATEEQYHYRLAEADLMTFGMKPLEERPQIVSGFDHFWMSIRPEEEYQYVGALYVLENVARFLKNDIMPHFARLQIGPGQAKFILTHLVADDDHGDQLKVLCSDLNDDAEYQLDIGAQKASEFWIEIHRDALSG